MSTSGTYNFNLSNMDVILEAFERAQVKPTALTNDQMISAYRSINIGMQTWANRGVNLWAVDLITLDLVVGQATYPLPSNTVQILDIYLRYTDTSTSPPTTTDRLLYPLSRTDYAAIPNKGFQGGPNTFWFDRLSPIPTITFWLVPNQGVSDGYTVQIYRTRRLQDANLTGAETLEIPYRFLDAVATDLAARLAQKFNPALWTQLKLDAKMAWDEAAAEDTERVSMFLTPDFEGYYGN